MEILILIVVLIIIFWVAFLVYFVKTGKKRREQFAKGCEFVENKLASDGFIISRQVGNFNEKWGEASFYLYVDDVKKQWVIANPMDSKIDMIRNFNDLIDFDFFDNDSNTWTDKLYRGAAKVGDGAAKINNTLNRGASGGSMLLGVFGTVAGISLGAAIGARGGSLGRVGLGGTIGGLAGGLAGGALGIRLSSNSPSPMPSEKLAETRLNASCEYGLAFLTSDCEKGQYLIFDFLTISGKVFKNLKKIERNARLYKKDIEVIQQMAVLFNDIINNSN